MNSRSTCWLAAGIGAFAGDLRAARALPGSQAGLSSPETSGTPRGACGRRPRPYPVWVEAVPGDSRICAREEGPRKKDPEGRRTRIRTRTKPSKAGRGLGWTGLTHYHLRYHLWAGVHGGSWGSSDVLPLRKARGQGPNGTRWGPTNLRPYRYESEGRRFESCRARSPIPVFIGCSPVCASSGFRLVEASDRKVAGEVSRATR
jgi:hypothetical protein